MGYSTNLLLNPHSIDDRFLCILCSELIKAPIMIEPCKHIFCTACIQDWIFATNTCPIDGDPIARLVSPTRSYTRSYNKLKVRCSFNGCTHISRLGALKDHLLGCGFNPEGIKTFCVHNCGANISNANNNHNCVNYLKEQLEGKNLEIEALKQELESKIQSHNENLELMGERLDEKNEEIDELKDKIGKLDHYVTKMQNFIGTIKNDNFKLRLILWTIVAVVMVMNVTHLVDSTKKWLGLGG